MVKASRGSRYPSMIPETFSGISLHRWTQTFQLFPDLKEQTVFFTEIPIEIWFPPRNFKGLHSLQTNNMFAHENRPGIPKESKNMFLAVGFSCIFFATHLAECWNKVKTVGGSAHGYIHCSLCRLAIAPDVSKKPIEVWLHLTKMVTWWVVILGKWGWWVVVGFAAFRNTSYILRLYAEIGNQVFGDFRMETWHE